MRRSRVQRLALGIVIAAFTLAMLAISGSFPKPEAQEKKEDMGGIWIFPPRPGMTITGPVTFTARAYPAPGKPKVDYVNFTLNWPGWYVKCTEEPVRADVYECQFDPAAAGMQEGTKFQVSFDVYNEEGDFHKAPNGVQDLIFDPTP